MAFFAAFPSVARLVLVNPILLHPNLVPAHYKCSSILYISVWPNPNRWPVKREGIMSRLLSGQCCHCSPFSSAADRTRQIFPHSPGLSTMEEGSFFFNGFVLRKFGAKATLIKYFWNAPTAVHWRNYCECCWKLMLTIANWTKFCWVHSGLLRLTDKKLTGSF